MLKEKLTKICNTVDKVKGKVSAAATMALVTAECGIVNAMAVGNGTQSNNPGGIVDGILEVIVNIFPLIGAFFIVAGVFKLIMAYRNNQPEDQTSAAKDIVIGAIFVAFRVFVWSAIKGLF